MISIRKFLDARGQSISEDDRPADATESLFRLLTGVLQDIGRHVLAGEDSRALRGRLEEVEGQLGPDTRPEAAGEAGRLIAEILAEHGAGSRQRSVAQAVEMQHIFATLNQALIALVEGKNQSVSRLTKIQASLRQASMIEDIVALKSSLEETVQFVQRESVKAQEASEKELGQIEAEVTRAREVLGSSRLELAGRPEGVKRITEWSSVVLPGQSLFVIAYHLDRMQAITQRYGPAVCDEMICHLIRERIQPVAPADTTYRWTHSSLVALFRRPPGLAPIQAELANLNRNPVIHRIALGNRTAVLTLAPSHLVVEGSPEAPDALVREVDRFTHACG